MARVMPSALNRTASRLSVTMAGSSSSTAAWAVSRLREAEAAGQGAVPG